MCFFDTIIYIFTSIFSSGAFKDSKTNMHFTPLLAAIRYTQPGAVQLLLSRGANIMTKDRLRYYNAVFWAVEIQHPEILKVWSQNHFIYSCAKCRYTKHIATCTLQGARVKYITY